jgi:hypothetical protein
MRGLVQYWDISTQEAGMIENITIIVEEIEETNVKWLQRLYVKTLFENVKLWTSSAHYAN